MVGPAGSQRRYKTARFLQSGLLSVWRVSTMEGAEE